VLSSQRKGERDVELNYASYKIYKEKKHFEYAKEANKKNHIKVHLLTVHLAKLPSNSYLLS